MFADQLKLRAQRLRQQAAAQATVAAQTAGRQAAMLRERAAEEAAVLRERAAEAQERRRKERIERETEREREEHLIREGMRRLRSGGAAASPSAAAAAAGDARGGMGGGEAGGVQGKDEAGEQQEFEEDDDAGAAADWAGTGTGTGTRGRSRSSCPRDHSDDDDDNNAHGKNHDSDDMWLDRNLVSSRQDCANESGRGEQGADPTSDGGNNGANYHADHGNMDLLSMGPPIEKTVGGDGTDLLGLAVVSDVGGSDAGTYGDGNKYGSNGASVWDGDLLGFSAVGASGDGAVKVATSLNDGSGGDDDDDAPSLPVTPAPAPDDDGGNDDDNKATPPSTAQPPPLAFEAKKQQMGEEDEVNVQRGADGAAGAETDFETFDDSAAETRASLSESASPPLAPPQLSLPSSDGVSDGAAGAGGGDGDGGGGGDDDDDTVNEVALDKMATVPTTATEAERDAKEGSAGAKAKAVTKGEGEGMDLLGFVAAATTSSHPSPLSPASAPDAPAPSAAAPLFASFAGDDADAAASATTAALPPPPPPHTFPHFGAEKSEADDAAPDAAVEEKERPAPPTDRSVPSSNIVATTAAATSASSAASPSLLAGKDKKDEEVEREAEAEAKSDAKAKMEVEVELVEETKINNFYCDEAEARNMDGIGNTEEGGGRAGMEFPVYSPPPTTTTTTTTMPTSEREQQHVSSPLSVESSTLASSDGADSATDADVGPVASAPPSSSSLTPSDAVPASASVSVSTAESEAVVEEKEEEFGGDADDDGAGAGTAPPAHQFLPPERKDGEVEDDDVEEGGNERVAEADASVAVAADEGTPPSIQASMSPDAYAGADAPGMVGSGAEVGAFAGATAESCGSEPAALAEEVAALPAPGGQSVDRGGGGSGGDGGGGSNDTDTVPSTLLASVPTIALEPMQPKRTQRTDAEDKHEETTRAVTAETAAGATANDAPIPSFPLHKEEGKELLEAEVVPSSSLDLPSEMAAEGGAVVAPPSSLPPETETEAREQEVKKEHATGTASVVEATMDGKDDADAKASGAEAAPPATVETLGEALAVERLVVAAYGDRAAAASASASADAETGTIRLAPPPAPSALNGALEAAAEEEGGSAKISAVELWEQAKKSGVFASRSDSNDDEEAARAKIREEMLRRARGGDASSPSSPSAANVGSEEGAVAGKSGAPASSAAAVAPVTATIARPPAAASAPPPKPIIARTPPGTPTLRGSLIPIIFPRDDSFLPPMVRRTSEGSVGSVGSKGEATKRRMPSSNRPPLAPVERSTSAPPLVAAPASLGGGTTVTAAAATVAQLPPSDLAAAMAKIKALTEERDAALNANADMLEKMNEELMRSGGKEQRRSDEREDERDSLLVELQSSLQRQMSARAEAENKVRQMEDTLRKFEEQLEEQLGKVGELEREVESANADLVAAVTEKSAMEAEVAKLREVRDESERKEMLLSSRLNDAKKREAAKANAAERLEAECASIRNELAKTKQQLAAVTAARDKLESNMEKLKKKCVERVKMAEGALTEERNLNEERKRKMKVFVETKAEELRTAKSDNDALRHDLEETRTSLRETREKLEQVHDQWVASQTRNRELQRDMNRMKKNSDHLHRIGDNLELELERSAQETEEHKSKRLTAKHELMTILRTLEAERAVSGKLKDSVKFTFTPKALSQQQLLTESLREFEEELQKLSRRLGRPLPPPPQPIAESKEQPGEENGTEGEFESDGGGNGGGGASASPSSGKKGRGRASRSDFDTSRLISNLESETQKVSRGIMALSASVERLHVLLDEGGDRSCVSVLQDLLASAAASTSQSGGAGGGGGGSGFSSSFAATGVSSGRFIAGAAASAAERGSREYDEHDQGVSMSEFVGVGGRSRGSGTERYGLVSGENNG